MTIEQFWKLQKRRKILLSTKIKNYEIFVVYVLIIFCNEISKECVGGPKRKL